MIENNIISELCKRYDSGFILLLIAQNINQGLWAMFILATQNYFKNVIGMQPE